MVATRLARILSATACLAALSACTTMEGAYDSVSNAFGGDEHPTGSKVEVRSPAAAPVQGVQAGDIGTPAQPVELGRMTSDNTPPSTQSAMDAKPSPIVPAAPAQQPQPMIVDNSKPPVLEPSAASVAAPAMAPAAAPAPMAPNADTAAVALLTVRFNQPHVYYEDALAQSVAAAEKAKPGVMYDVLSSIPDLTSLPSDAQTKLSARAKDNLRNVVVQMQQQGIPANRIRIAEQTLKIRSQEIRVFVR